MCDYGATDREQDLNELCDAADCVNYCIKSLERFGETLKKYNIDTSKLDELAQEIREKEDEVREGNDGNI